MEYCLLQNKQKSTVIIIEERFISIFLIRPGGLLTTLDYLIKSRTIIRFFLL